jgi:hypothetical protein
VAIDFDGGLDPTFNSIAVTDARSTAGCDLGVPEVRERIVSS